MHLFVLIAKLCFTQAHWRSLLLRDWRGTVAKRPAGSTVCTKSFPARGLHCAVSSPRPAQEKQRYWSSMWHIVQFNSFIHILYHKHHNIWLVRKVERCLVIVAFAQSVHSRWHSIGQGIKWETGFCPEYKCNFIAAVSPRAQNSPRHSGRNTDQRASRD